MGRHHSTSQAGQLRGWVGTTARAKQGISAAEKCVALRHGTALHGTHPTFGVCCAALAVIAVAAAHAPKLLGPPASCHGKHRQGGQADSELRDLDAALMICGTALMVCGTH